MIFPNQVYAFEPSVLNLKWLAKNIALNDVADKITIIPVPLTATNGIATFRLSSLDEGGALSAFGVEFGHDGLPLATQMRYEMLGLSLDFMFASGMLPDAPSTIKIDVDGIEHLVLQGAVSVLRNESLRSVLVEVDESFGRLSHEVEQVLEDAGLRFREKKHGELFESGKFATTYNQVWVGE